MVSLFFNSFCLLCHRSSTLLQVPIYTATPQSSVSGHYQIIHQHMKNWDQAQNQISVESPQVHSMKFVPAAGADMILNPE